MLPEGSLSTESSPERSDLGGNRGFWELRGVHWRTDLGVLPCSSSADDVRRVTANTRRRYAALRRRLLIDPLIHKDGSNFPDPVMDNPLSQDPDSMWGRFFQKAELEKMVDQDLSRLYPEHGSYFQTPGCQGMLRRILLLWCISHPNYGYRQGMHELLAPLLYVLQADVERLSAVRKLYEHYFTDNFDGLTFHDSDELETQDDQVKFHNLEELDPKIQTIISFSDAYGAEGELGIVLSEKFMEHDAYCMFDALMNGSGGAVSMASFFSPSNGPQNGLPPVIEASSALYQLLAVVDSSLYTHFVELGVEPQYFALRWLRVLFGREFALEDLLVIWDAIFSFDNSKLNSENDNETNFEALNSSRGAFIASLAVSMILYIRSSILATETATSCLQRLLNFPKDVNLGKLLKKANSLVNDAINAMRSAPPPMYSDGFHEPVKPVTTMGFRTHSLSSDAAAPRSPLSVVRDSYWEEKWRVLHKEEEQKQTNPQKQSQRKGWSEKVKSRLLRTESDPSSSKAYGEKTGPSRRRVRRSLLDDLARQLGLEEEEETETEKAVGGNGGSEENSSIFSDPPSPIGGVNDNDNDNDNVVLEKNLGQSMVENLQVIESVFQQEKGETGQVDNLSKKALVDRGQMTAMAALKELRKISNILSEM
ncbi:putative Rab-GTPase-TBC domain-containing protein [Helianthus annuus]|nr:putative Rab-GTPase-TBC domain-containing protein [Helianthus annuus]